MADAPLILGVSGLRGIVGESLSPEVAVRYAAAFGEWLKERTGEYSPIIAIGRDGRAGGEAMYQAAIAGLVGMGCRVIRLGVATTPTVGLIAGEDADGGMVVTASHNPAEWNGLKCLVVDEIRFQDETTEPMCRAPSAEEADEIIGRFRRGVEYPSIIPEQLLSDEGGASMRHEDACYYWHRELLDDATFSRFEESRGHGLRCVVDAVNCSGAGVGVSFLDSMGEVIGLNCTGSGIFPHTPEPTKANLSGDGGLCDAVVGLKADIGFAQDPDADRLAIVDEHGAYIGEEYTLALCAMSVLEALEGEARGSVLVANLSTSRMIEDVAAKYDARVERTPVGEANVVQRMKGLLEAGERMVLGGEGNGGVIWPEVVFVRDSIGSMAMVLALMARTGLSVSELVRKVDRLGAGGAGYGIVKEKVEIGSKAEAEPAVRAVAGWGEGVAGARIDLQDGVRLDFDEGAWRGSWVHVRASNTEPIMRLICEAPSDEIARAVLGAVEGAIAG